VGALDGGFVLPGLRVLTDHEIFRRARRLPAAASVSRSDATAATRALKAGDYWSIWSTASGSTADSDDPVGAEGGTLEVAVVEYEGGSR